MSAETRIDAVRRLYDHYLDGSDAGFGQMWRKRADELEDAVREHLGPTTEAADEITRLREENTRIRAALAVSNHACVYCELPADEWAKCSAGFPGCARADDMTGCPEFGAAQNEHYLREALDVAVEALEKMTGDEVDGDADFSCAYCLRDYVLDGHADNCRWVKAREVLARIRGET